MGLGDSGGDFWSEPRQYEWGIGRVCSDRLYPAADRSKKFFVGPLWGSKKEERGDVENDSELRQGGWNGTREGI